LLAVAASTGAGRGRPHSRSNTPPRIGREPTRLLRSRMQGRTSATTRRMASHTCGGREASSRSNSGSKVVGGVRITGYIVCYLFRPNATGKTRAGERAMNEKRSPLDWPGLNEVILPSVTNPLAVRPPSPSSIDPRPHVPAPWFGRSCGVKRPDPAARAWPW
jgi:hypothetical protein